MPAFLHLTENMLISTTKSETCLRLDPDLWFMPGERQIKETKNFTSKLCLYEIVRSILIVNLILISFVGLFLSEQNLFAFLNCLSFNLYRNSDYIRRFVEEFSGSEMCFISAY